MKENSCSPGPVKEDYSAGMAADASSLDDKLIFICPENHMQIYEISLKQSFIYIIKSNKFLMEGVHVFSLPFLHTSG